MHAAAQLTQRSNPVFGFSAGAAQEGESALGLQECRVFLNGAAPITLDTLNYFGSLTINIVEVYSMSENTGPQTCGKPSWFGGHVRPLRRRDQDRPRPDQGQARRGRGVLPRTPRHDGLHAQRREDRETSTRTMASLGDVSCVDAETKLLGITGRIKELIITAGGEHRARPDRGPQVPAPRHLQRDDRRQAQVQHLPHHAAGPGPRHRRRVPGCRSSATPRRFPPPRRGDRRKDPSGRRTSRRPRPVQQGGGVQRRRSRSSPSWTATSVPGNELTSTQKLKRGVVTEKFKAVIDGMY